MWVSDRVTGREIAWLSNAVDLHVHTAPATIDRAQLDLDFGREAIEEGMATAVIKSHAVPTMSRVQSVNRAIGSSILKGGITLNGPVGGLNVDAVEVALALEAAIVWLPTLWAENHASRLREAGDTKFVGLRVPRADEMLRVSYGRRVTESVRAIIDLAARYNAVVATGHISPEEIDAVVRACGDAGVTVLVNHPFFHVTDLSIDHQLELAEQGAIMEYCAYAIEETRDHSVDQVVDAIDRIGPERCVLASDYGQQGNPAVPGLASFAEAVHAAGLPQDAVRCCLSNTPARVLDG